MNQPRFYHADGATETAPVTPLAPAATPPTPTAAATHSAPTPVAGIDMAALSAAITQGVTAALAPVTAQLAALPVPQQAAAPPAGGQITAPVQVALATGQPPVAPVINLSDARMTEYLRRPGALLAMFLQARAYAAHSARMVGRNITPIERATAAWGTSHPATLQLMAEDHYALNGGGSYNLAGQNTRDFVAGGALVPRDLSRDLIEALKEKAVIRSLGPRVISSPRGIIDIPTSQGGTTASYIGEGQPANFSTAQWGLITLVSKKLAGIVRWTWEAANRPVFDLVDLLLADLFQTMALTEDAALLRSLGGPEPRGITTQMAAANKLAATTGWAAGDDNVRARIVRKDRSRLKLALRNANVPDDGSRAWLMPPTVSEYLQNVQTSQAQLVFPETMNGKWGNYPYRDTTLLPDDLSGPASELLLVQMSQVILADESDVRTETSASFTVTVGGVVKTLADVGEVGTMVTALHDMALRHTEGAAMITNCPWSLEA